jgi:hypothetical protein
MNTPTTRKIDSLGNGIGFTTRGVQKTGFCALLVDFFVNLRYPIRKKYGITSVLFRRICSFCDFALSGVEIQKPVKILRRFIY